MKNLYLVRHGTPDFKDGIKLCIGRTDIDIGEQGILEAINLREFFKDKLRNGEIDKIYSSPLTRCLHTAELIAGENSAGNSVGNKEVITDDALMEIYMGCWEGVPLKDIKKELGDEPYDGEKRVDALKRFEKSLREIMNKTDGDAICVAHAGVNCVFLASIMGENLRTSRSLKQPYGGYNHLKYDGEKFSVVDIGLLPNPEIL